MATIISKERPVLSRKKLLLSRKKTVIIISKKVSDGSRGGLTTEAYINHLQMGYYPDLLKIIVRY